ncbi:hypothetical protein [Lactococcus lactis]|uniref:Uncharacterized protein n=1 Tax=Lactococcus lactis TaxID=1358 RepID=A0AB35K9Y3_9LACT|nr:hypothetical protein [Lactococcus lactis]MDG4978925.1 hypothetical protein [Lactococcus lactis]MDG5048533.1 hypothetical protein [Lactococcus lactis]
MIDSEYNKFVTKMSNLFNSYNGKERVILGQSPFPDGKNIVCNNGRFKQVAFLRSVPPDNAKTEKTVNRIWHLLFGDKAQNVRDLLDAIQCSKATATKEEYLAKYLTEEQKFYLINAFEDRDCKIITEDLKNLNADVECREILIVGKEALCGIKYLSKNEIKFIMHPSARGLNKETVAKQWDSFSHKGTGIYNSSDEIINVFQIK